LRKGGAEDSLNIKAQIAEFSARQGVSKSAVIVRSIEEFLSKNAQASSFEIYEQAMRGSIQADTTKQLIDPRPSKQQLRATLRRKHAARSARAGQALIDSASEVKQSAVQKTRKSA
jgi:hypothetical protein